MHVAAAIVGGGDGGVAGYLFFTDRGRAWRRQLEPALEDFARELVQLPRHRAEGGGRRQRRLESVERSARRAGRPALSDPHQSTPF